MSGVLKFGELVTPPSFEKEPSDALEIAIDVAGPKAVEAKTVRCSLDQRGLIQLSFKEGGKLPEILGGRFTTMEEVKTALTIWQARRAKEFVLDENVTHPHSSEPSKDVDTAVTDAVQNSAPPAFPDQLDESLPEVEKKPTTGRKRK